MYIDQIQKQRHMVIAGPVNTFFFYFLFPFSYPNLWNTCMHMSYLGDIGTVSTFMNMSYVGTGQTVCMYMYEHV